MRLAMRLLSRVLSDGQRKGKRPVVPEFPPEFPPEYRPRVPRVQKAHDERAHFHYDSGYLMVYHVSRFEAIEEAE